MVTREKTARQKDTQQTTLFHCGQKKRGPIAGHRGQTKIGGPGRSLPRRVFGLALAQRDRVGCIGVVVDAKVDALGCYEALGFVPVEGAREGLLVGQPRPMFLGINTVASALKS